MDESRLEEVKIAVVKVTLSRESVPQSKGSLQKASQMELLHYKRNTKGMRMGRSCVHGMACLLQMSELVQLVDVAGQTAFYVNNVTGKDSLGAFRLWGTGCSVENNSGRINATERDQD